MFAISTPFDDPDRGAERERKPRVVRVHVHLESRLVADDEERVPDVLELALQRCLVERVPLDDEHRAVAVRGELQVDRVEAQRLRLDRHLRQRLAGSAETSPRAISTSPAPPASTTPAFAQDVEQLGCPREGVLPARENRLRGARSDGCARCSFRSPSSAISRMTVSIVPSTGRLTAR